jgi:hypothetical protein
VLFNWAFPVEHEINNNNNSCICHTVHLIAVDAAKMIPESVENLLQP